METYVLDEDLRRKHGAEAKKRVAAYTWSRVVETLRKRLLQIDL